MCGRGRGLVVLRADDRAKSVLSGFAGSLRSARETAGISQKALAAALSVAASSLCGWETGYSVPDLDHLIAWPRQLGLQLVVVNPNSEMRHNGMPRWRGESLLTFERRRLATPLRNRRLALGMSQGELSNLIGVCTESIRGWELSHVPPRPVSLVVWAHGLGCRVVLRPNGTVTVLSAAKGSPRPEGEVLVRERLGAWVGN